MAGNFTAEEAAQLGREIRTGLVTPCHDKMFEFNTTSPDGFAEAAQRLGQPFRVLKYGERLSLKAMDIR